MKPTKKFWRKPVSVFVALIMLFSIIVPQKLLIAEGSPITPPLILSGNQSPIDARYEYETAYNTESDEIKRLEDEYNQKKKELDETAQGYADKYNTAVTWRKIGVGAMILGAGLAVIGFALAIRRSRRHDKRNR